MPDANEANKQIIGRSAGPVFTAAGVMRNGILDGRTDLAHIAAMCFNKSPCSLDLSAAKK